MSKIAKTKENIKRYTMRDLQKMKSKTDWEKFDALTDETIDYSDIPDMADDRQFWANAKVVDYSKQPISIRVDSDVLVWFKNQKGRYQKLMNHVLREYMEAQQHTLEKRKSKKQLIIKSLEKYLENRLSKNEIQEIKKAVAHEIHEKYMRK